MQGKDDGSSGRILRLALRAHSGLAQGKLGNVDTGSRAAARPVELDVASALMKHEARGGESGFLGARMFAEIYGTAGPKSNNG